MRVSTWKKSIAVMLACGTFLWVVPAGATALELTLDDSIQMALRNNPTIKIADAEKKIAKSKINQAQSGNMPALTYAHTAARYKSNTLTTGVLYDNKYDNTVRLTFPLYTGGEVEGLIKQAELGYDAAILGIAKAKQQIKLDATTAYFNVLQARNMVDLNKESVERLQAHLKNVQAQYEVGTVAKVDVLRSEVELANAEQNLIKAQNSYDLALASLNNVLGIPLDTQVQVKDNLKYQKYDKTIDDCIKYALQNRPEIGQMDASLKIAQKGISVARSGYLPTLALAGTANWNNDEFPGDENSNWTVSLQAGFNVFDAGLTKAKVRQAKATHAKTTQEVKQTSDAVQLEVRQAYLSLREAEKRIATAKVAVEKAEEDYKIAQVRYSAGVGTNIDVMDAQVALTQAKTNYVQAMYDYNTNQAKLNKAMGMSI